MVHARGARRSPSSAISRTIGFLLGSGGPHIAITLTRQPSVSARDAQHALRTALSRGGDWAELYWERHETLQLVLDDGRIEDAISGVDQGAGIRVTKGERTTYANSNVADVDDLIALAGRAARGVAEVGELHETSDPAPDELARPSTVAIDPRDVAVERKGGQGRGAAGHPQRRRPARTRGDVHGRPVERGRRDAHPRVRRAWPRGRPEPEGSLGVLGTDRPEGRERAHHGHRRRDGSQQARDRGDGRRRNADSTGGAHREGERSDVPLGPTARRGGRHLVKPKVAAQVVP